MSPRSLVRRFRSWRRQTTSKEAPFTSVAQLHLPDANRLLSRNALGDASSNPLNLTHLLDKIEAQTTNPEFPPHILLAANSLTGVNAERLIELRFTLSSEQEVAFDSEIDWQFDPTSDPNRRWAKALHRHQWLIHIAKAYRETNDQKYVDHAGKILLDWIEKNPPPATKDEQNVAWTLMGAGIRAMIWPDALKIFIACPRFKELVAPRMLLSLHDHAEFLASYQTHLNHLLREANGLLHIGLRYPEFLKSEEWRATAIRRLEEEVEKQVQSDGSHIELSPAYQWLVAEELESTLQLCFSPYNQGELNALGTKVAENLKKLYDYLRDIATPASTWPQIKEGFYPPQSQLRAQLLAAAERDGDESLEWVATQGKSGSPPDEKTKSHHDACCTVFRNEWSPQANYLIFQNGAFGGPHGHEDALSIELWVGGTQFIADPGTDSYNINDPFRHYFTSSNAHNTVLPDGMSQVRRWSKNQWWQSPAAPHNHFVNHSGELSWVTGTYAGRYAKYTGMRGKYKNASKGITHRRQVIFVQEKYWLLVDDLVAPKPTVFYRTFQCAADIRATKTNCGMRLSAGDSSTDLYIAAGESVDIEVSEGQNHPIAGWICDGSRNSRKAAPQIFLSSRRCRNTKLVTLLMPTSTNDVEPTVKLLDASSGQESVEVSYSSGSSNFTDVVLLGTGDEAPRLRQ